jgi:hypothetical protein
MKIKASNQSKIKASNQSKRRVINPGGGPRFYNMQYCGVDKSGQQGQLTRSTYTEGHKQGKYTEGHKQGKYTSQHVEKKGNPQILLYAVMSYGKWEWRRTDNKANSQDGHTQRKDIHKGSTQVNTMMLRRVWTTEDVTE